MQSIMVAIKHLSSYGLFILFSIWRVFINFKDFRILSYVRHNMSDTIPPLNIAPIAIAVACANHIVAEIMNYAFGRSITFLTET
jgi:hypothetical protein